jgi:hypothetical protein
MTGEIVPQPGQSGNPGRRRGSRNKATLAAAILFDGEALELTRTAVEATLAGDMLEMKLCLERVLPRCHERPVRFCLPSLAAIGDGEIDEPSPQNPSRAMNAVPAALACGGITPGSRQRSNDRRGCANAGIVGEKVAQGNLLQILTAGDDVEDEDEDDDIRDCDPWTAAGETSVEVALFNLEEKFSCRFSADAGS